MKKLTIIGLLAAIVIACILLIRYHDKVATERDQAFRERLSGTWSREEDNLPRRAGFARSITWTNTVAADGSFVELSWFRHSYRTNTYQRTGTWFVKNGHLIETIKTSTNPSEVTPYSEVGRIVNSDATGFAVRWQHSTNEMAWQRVTK
ncbi:MAG: hypothetical protein KGR98_02995 [Verrucomicrobia bacterium]|nr:hypothetical protein [Verrucomicrobiota bacterium]MDE3100233.1 hypothetical protein [Verrucomicrobiota bacterium]